MASRRSGRVDSGGVDRVVLAFAAALIVVGSVAADSSSAGTRGFGALAVVLLGAGSVAVLAGGRFPATSAAVALAITFVWYGTGHEHGIVNVVTMAAFYRFGASEASGRKVVVTGAAVGATGLLMVGFGGEPWQTAANSAGYVVMAVLFGELLRNRRLLVEQYADRAARAETDARERLAEERLDIARDVHDVLAHTVSVMSVQAAVALDSFDRDRSRAVSALESIRTEGRRAMDEVRAIVALLRAPAGSDHRSPAPRLGQIEELAASARGHGLEVEVDVDVSAVPLSELVELTAFRVVQESLTNVGRHAVAASQVVIRIRAVDAGLSVEVRDDGRPSGPVRPGFGLRGMAERVEAIGGTLHHGFDGRDGFVVRAICPAGGSSR